MCHARSQVMFHFNVCVFAQAQTRASHFCACASASVAILFVCVLCLICVQFVLSICGPKGLQGGKKEKTKTSTNNKAKEKEKKCSSTPCYKTPKSLPWIFQNHPTSFAHP